jgi:hypothetical protein
MDMRTQRPTGVSHPALRPGLRVDHVGTDAVVLDHVSGLVHRLTGPAAEVIDALVMRGHDVDDLPSRLAGAVSGLREAGVLRGDVPRRQALGAALAGTVGILTLTLPSALAAASAGGPGGTGGGGTGDGIEGLPAGMSAATGYSYQYALAGATFESSCPNFALPGSVTTFDILLVGGGGGGGVGETGKGGGGGAGAPVNVFLNQNVVFDGIIPTCVGRGGVDQISSTESFFIRGLLPDDSPDFVQVSGGGNGGPGTDLFGGTGGASVATDQTGGSPGGAGASGSNVVGSIAAGGGGAGAGGNGSAATVETAGGAGGSGFVVSGFFGADVTFSGGGGGAGSTSGGAGGSGAGAGGTNADPVGGSPTGFGSGAGGSFGPVASTRGSGGLVVVRYQD